MGSPGMVNCRRLGGQNALVKEDEWQEMSLVKMVGSLVCDEQTSLMSKPEISEFGVPTSG